jgi:predicted transcriptional regulator of viral defense system
MKAATMVNETFEPTDRQERVLAVFKDEYRANPLRVRDVTGLEKQRVNEALGSLVDAGWVRRVNRGLYEFIADPRDE